MGKNEMEKPAGNDANRKSEQQERLDEALHKLLIIGLAISVVLISIGLVIALVTHQEIPTSMPALADVFSHVFALQPSGFLSLGLLVLIATPVVRVISSFIAFLFEKDWRFAGITFIVLVAVITSVLLGKE